MSIYDTPDDYDNMSVGRLTRIFAFPDDDKVTVNVAQERTPIFRVRGYIQTNGSLNKFPMSRIRITSSKDEAVKEAGNVDSFFADSVEQVCLQGQPLYLVIDFGKKIFNNERNNYIPF